MDLIASSEENREPAFRYQSEVPLIAKLKGYDVT